MRSVLIVDDEVAEREVLATVLGAAGYSVITAETGEHGLRLARAQPPAVIVADILMPSMDGYELVRDLRSDPVTAHIPVIFYTATYVIDEIRSLAAACGVSHILIRPYEPEEVLRVVFEALASGPEAVASLPSEDFHREHLRMVNAKLVQKVDELRETIILANALQREPAAGPAGNSDGDSAAPALARDGRLETLSPREREVLSMIVDGASNGAIAQRLTIATSTVQSHVKRIFHKLGVKNRTEAAVLCVRR
ncbi:MAG TPA: response regulator transcription factor [Solirubrobacteraceae bacterium]|jgi:DNA-binding NarL/FixJ family response regulator|nr:response regulator transcription factor [Solirubrobacteraceae bacterium]